MAQSTPRKWVLQFDADLIQRQQRVRHQHHDERRGDAYLVEDPKWQCEQVQKQEATDLYREGTGERRFENPFASTNVIDQHASLLLGLHECEPVELLRFDRV